ncbi:MAG: septum formation inhibitor Maf [Cyanobacteria bacterium J083]|nr:MAG: septum formation inhibitor Maf [Cyanobacteria bacterium J083]
MSVPLFPFVLASASPARRQLLQKAGIEPVVQSSNFDESQIISSQPRELVTTLARYKAETVAPNYENALVLGCDSVLAIGEEIYGKPVSPSQAISRWQKMRGNRGTLYTGHALISTASDQTVVKCGVTEVYFADISDRQITEYVATGEPLQCAGCFALEGKGGMFVEKIEGCYSNVIGLSLPLLRQMLEELGYNVSNFWQK